MTVQDLAAIATAAVAIISVVIAAATVYLRLYINNRLSDLEDKLMGQMENKYPRADVVNVELGTIKQRLSRLEGAKNLRMARES